jgi:hypothetical protein
MKQHSPAGWMVRCTDCSYGAHFGKARESATLACTRHRFKLHHTIGLYAVSLEHLWNADLDNQMMLDDIPPF